MHQRRSTSLRVRFLLFFALLLLLALPLVVAAMRARPS